MYKLVSSNYSAQVGNDVISFHISNNYPGWKEFSKNIFQFYERIIATDVISKVDSFAIRYLNFFELNIFDKINLSVNLNSEPYDSDNIVIKTEKKEGEFISVMQIANNVNLHRNNDSFKGSLLDISCTLNRPNNFFDDWKTDIEKLIR